MTDADLIDKAGGPSALAARLRFEEKGAVQRVSNWKRRGIPPAIRWEHRAVFEEIEVGTDAAPSAPVLPDVRQQEAA